MQRDASDPHFLDFFWHPRGHKTQLRRTLPARCPLDYAGDWAAPGAREVSSCLLPCSSRLLTLPSTSTCASVAFACPAGGRLASFFVSAETFTAPAAVAVLPGWLVLVLVPVLLLLVVVLLELETSVGFCLCPAAALPSAFFGDMLGKWLSILGNFGKCNAIVTELSLLPRLLLQRRFPALLRHGAVELG